MRNLAAALLCLTALGCATPGGLPPMPAPPCAPSDINCLPSPDQQHRKFGDVSNSPQGQWVCGFQRGATAGPACPVVTGSGATVIVFSTTSQGDFNRGMFPGIQRVLVHLRFDQGVTVLYQTLAAGSTTWRTLNGGGVGDTLAASTDYITDFLVMGPDVRVAVVTGGTGPSVQEESVEIFYTRELGQ